jgi:hypothetical protein
LGGQSAGKQVSYQLRAVIVADELLHVASQEVPGARVVSLHQGLSLMPMTDEVFDAVADGSDGGGLGFWRLPGGFKTLLAQWSSAGPIACVEAEYFGAASGQKSRCLGRRLAGAGTIGHAGKQVVLAPGQPIPQVLRRLAHERSAEATSSEPSNWTATKNEDWILSSTG